MSHGRFIDVKTITLSKEIMKKSSCSTKALSKLTIVTVDLRKKNKFLGNLLCKGITNGKKNEKL
jgi:hypothetical protein